jgi:hypothetical protein
MGYMSKNQNVTHPLYRVSEGQVHDDSRFIISFSDH